MKTYIIIMIVLHLLEAGSALATKPDQPREPISASALLVRVILGTVFAAWGLNLVVDVA